MQSVFIEDFSEVIQKQTFIMPIIAVYKNPTDMPDKAFVARLFDVIKPTMFCVTGETLDEVRRAIPKTMTRFTRSDSDPRNLVESWA